MKNLNQRMTSPGHLCRTEDIIKGGEDKARLGTRQLNCKHFIEGPSSLLTDVVA